jgi:putative oxidoreductase
MKFTTTNTDLGALILRLIVGIVFVYHGYAKLTGMEGTIGFFASLGFAPILAYLVAWIETLGGVLMILGIGARVIAPLFVAIMLVATFVAKDGSFKKAELDIVLLCASLAIYWIGAGSYRVPAFWVKKQATAPASSTPTAR